ncbi:MAG TPA: hypothetical protein VGB95_05415 [Chitinophagales bacterium]
MQFLRNTIIIAAVTFLAQLLFPWWIIAPVAFVLGYALCKNGGQAFFSAFLAVFLLWAIYALVIDIHNEHILSMRIAELFKLPNSTVLILVTGVVGGLVAGFSALSGRLIKNLM